MRYKLNVNVGKASYWSEIDAISSIDNLKNAGIIDDPIEYLKRIPDGYVPDKQGLIDYLEAKREQPQQEIPPEISETALLEGIETA
jgi:hypothetical protein